ncbi:MAG: rhomboid family intramembrane serine protease [Spirochaetales bacterium]|nr:rhomboid family intramembrane serine protease [Spirochaetales bacterium]
MDILLLVLYFGLSFVLIEFGKIVTHKNRLIFYHRIIMLSVLLIVHVMLIFFAPDSFRNPVVIILLFPVTALFTMGAASLKNIFYKNFISNMLSSNNFTFFVYICNLDYHSRGLLTLKGIIPLLRNNSISPEEVLDSIAKHTGIKNYLLWNRDVLSILWFLDKTEVAVHYYESLTIDFSQPGLPLDLISIVINILLKKQRYPEISPYFEYIEKYYRDIQHQQVILYLYLAFYANTGCSENFNFLLERNSVLSKDPMVMYWQGILLLKTDRVEQGLSLLNSFKESLPSHLKSFLPGIEKIINNPHLYTEAPEKGKEIARSIIPFQSIEAQRTEVQSKGPNISAGIIALCGTVLVATLVQFALLLAGTRLDFINFKDVVPLDYIRLGAYSDFFINKGQWPRLLTAIFLHAGWLHLLVNIYGLFITGKFVEKAYGTFNMILIFIVSGLIGNIASHILSPYPLSLGASGGVFGLLAAIFVFVFQRRKTMNKSVLQNFLINFIIIIGINIMFGLQNPRINNIAHFGGFAGGFGISVLYLALRKNPRFNNTVNTVTQLAIVLCISILLIFWPQFYSYNYLNKLDMDKKISLNGYSLMIPSLWDIQSQDNNNVIVDFLTGNKILVRKDNASLQDSALRQEIEKEIEAYNAKENYGADYNPGKPLIKLNTGWYSFSLYKKNTKRDYYDYITFYIKSFESSVCHVISFSLKKYASPFDTLVKRVLNLINE